MMSDSLENRAERAFAGGPDLPAPGPSTGAKSPKPRLASGMNEQEAQWIERCRAGDLEAFERLLGAHQDAVYRTALRLMGDPEEAMDLAQDVLLTAFRKISLFRGDSRFSTWLYRITVNLARNRWKAAGRHPHPISLDSGGGAGGGDEDGESGRESIDLVAGGVSPREEAAGHELARALERELARMPEAYREVVVLRHIEGLSYEEIAETLDEQLGTVKSRLARAREMLRERLGPLLDEAAGQEKARGRR